MLYSVYEITYYARNYAGIIRQPLHSGCYPNHHLSNWSGWYVTTYVNIIQYVNITCHITFNLNLKLGGESRKAAVHLEIVILNCITYMIIHHSCYYYSYKRYIKMQHAGFHHLSQFPDKLQKILYCVMSWIW